MKTSCKGRRHSASFRFIDYRNFCIYLMISILVNDLPKLSYLWCHRLLGKFVVSKHCFRISFELLVNAFKEDFHFNSKGLWDLTEVESFLTTLLSPLESWWSYFLSVSFLPSRPSRPTIKKVWFSVSAIKIIRTGTPVSKTTWFKKKLGFAHLDQLTVAAASPVSSAVVLFCSFCRNLKMESVELIIGWFI